MTLIETLQAWDTDLFLILNGFHSPFWDTIMFYASNKYVWIPVYLFLLYFLIKYYKRKAIWIFMTIVVLIGVSDLLSVHAFKNVFLRLRPCHDPALEGMVHTVFGKCGGEFGFYSSHASNHFALAGILSRFLGKKIPVFTILIFLWAAFISYSRIYLGVHYPGDVLAGALMGVFLGFLAGKLYMK